MGGGPVSPIGGNTWGGKGSDVGGIGAGFATKSGSVANKQKMCMIRGKNSYLVLIV